MSVDGTDFKIQEPGHFDKAWYSHKLKGPGVRYKIAICIETGEIVWACGPFPCGSYPDVKIFRAFLKNLLDRSNEKAIADGGYRDPTCILPPGNGVHKRVRARHEAMNGRLTNFFVLRHTFRHHPNRHSDCFYAVLSIVHLL